MSFIAQVGDGEIKVYFSELDEEKQDTYIPAVIVQNGELSDLTWVMVQDDVGDVVLCWIGVLFVSMVLFFIPVKDSD